MNAVDGKVSTQALAISGPTRRAPSAMTLASLCSRARRAVSGSDTKAQRQAGWRLTEIEMPTPEPHRAMPRSAHPAPGDRFGDLVAVIGIVDRIDAARAEIDHLVALGWVRDQHRLHVDRRMIGSNDDPFCPTPSLPVRIASIP